MLIPSPLRNVVSTDAGVLRAYAGSRGPVWCLPRAVARPRDADDVAPLLAWAADEGLPVTPRGGATGMPGGNVGPGLVLDLGALDGFTWREDHRVVAGAGAVAAALDARARVHGRWLPALPSSARWCTAGGMLATDAAGARSFRYGPAHAWTPEVRLVRASGETERHRRIDAPSGAPPWGPLRRDLARTPLPPPPRLRKNASGYAVDRFVETGDPIQLLAGSEGTLGVITEVVFDTEALPEATGAAVVGVPGADDLPDLVALARVAGAVACEFLGSALLRLGRLRDDSRLEGLHCGAGVVLLEFAGPEEAVDAALAEVARVTAAAGGARITRDADEIEALWALRHDASPAIAAAAGNRRSLQFIEDGVVPVEALPAYLAGLGAILDREGLEAVVFGHAGDGNLHVNPLVDLGRPGWRDTVRRVLDEVTELVADLGGTPSGEHGDGRLRAPLSPRVWDAPRLRAFRAVKEALDPEGLLNPGVVLPLTDQDPLDGFAVGPDLQLPAPAGRAR